LESCLYKGRKGIMKKKLGPLSLNRETVRCLSSATLSGIAGAVAETGSNPHSVCLTCSCVGCITPPD
jgi:hypothetical protein